MRGSLLAGFVVLTCLLPVPAEEPKYPPTAAYIPEEIEGFTVLVHPDVLKHDSDIAEVRKELALQLKAINRVVPANPLAKLKKVRIWVEWQKKKNGAAEFHVSPGWLKENGYNPDKVGAVELSNARNFVKWSRGEQPWMVMHEFAHAYHFLTLGDNHDGIAAAYKQAMARKLYDSVEYVNGGKRKAYAATNKAEYFAELSEAYFGKNDFYPFTRTDLEKHDPVGYKLMQEVWGKPNEAKP